MKKAIILTRLLAMILLGGAMTMSLESCSDKDNPASGQTMAQSLVGEWIWEMKINGILSHEDMGDLYVPTDVDQTTLIYHFYADGSGWKEFPVLKDGQVETFLCSRYESNFTYTVDANGRVTVTFVDGEAVPTGEVDELRFDGKTLSGKVGDFDAAFARATEAQVKQYTEASDKFHGGSEEGIKITGLKASILNYESAGSNLPATRSLGFSVEQTPKLINYWLKGEEVQVVQGGTVIGTLKSNENQYSGTTMLNGELSTLPDAGKPLEFHLHTAAYDWTDQKGNLTERHGAHSIEANTDFAKAVVPAGKFTVDKEKNSVSIKDVITFEHMNALLHFNFQTATGAELKVARLTLSGEDAEAKPAILLTGGIQEQTCGNLLIDPSASPWQNGYVSIATTGPMKLTVIAEDADGLKYVYTTAEPVTFAAGKIYQNALKMTPEPATIYRLEETIEGMIVGNDGKAYAVVDKNNLPRGVEAAGMVAYKNGSHGLVIALKDEPSNMNWNEAKGENGAAAHKPTVIGYSWRLPSIDEWLKMFKAFGGDERKNTGLNIALERINPDSRLKFGTMWESPRYWSSTPYTETKNRAQVVILDEDWVSPNYFAVFNSYPVRACFEF